MQSRKRWIPSPPSEARDRTRILMDTSRIRFCCAMTGTPWLYIFHVLNAVELFAVKRLLL